MSEQKTTIGKSIILGSDERFDLRSVPFSIRGSYLCILENQEDRCLYLSISRSPSMMIERKNLVKVAPVVDNKMIPFTYTVEPGRLAIKTYKGIAEICFAGQKQLRVRGNGISLRFSFKMRQFENCSPKENGDYEVAYEILGKLLFVPLRGSIWCNAKWNHNTVQSDDFIIDLIPPVETMQFEAAIHEYYSNGTRDENYIPFDHCAQAANEDFDAFRKRFGMVPERYDEMANLAAWTIWTHSMRPEGRQKNPVIYMSRVSSLRAYSGQQCYQAMASDANAKEAWKLLLTMFDYQNDSGRIPNNIGDISIGYAAACPALQGVALDYIMNRFDLSELSPDDYAELYGKLSRFTHWWLAKRDRNASGIPQYYHPDESICPHSSIFSKGLPVQSGDLLAFLVLLTESCGKLAINAGLDSESVWWMNESKRFLNILLKDFWNGQQFICRSAGSLEIVETGSVTSLLPIILGKRLPDDIIETIANRLASQDEYLTRGGVVAERIGSVDFAFSDAVLRGNIVAPIQLLLIMGLKNAGKAELAKTIAVRYCDQVCIEGLDSVLSAFRCRHSPIMMEKNHQVMKTSSNENKASGKLDSYEEVTTWSSEAAAIFLTIASYIFGEGCQL